MTAPPTHRTEVPAAEAVELVEPSRDERVAEAVRHWSEQVAALGGPDALLHFRDDAAGTLDLTNAHPSGLAMLLAGRPTRLSDLVRESGALRDARRRARAIRAKTLELADEHGVAAGWLAVGLATWDAPDRPPSAPVLLRACVLRPRGADDFDIDLSAETELNPVLVGELAAHSVHVDADALAALALIGAGFDPAPVLRAVAQLGAAVPGFAVEQRLALGTFVPGRLALAADTTSANLGGHDVVAALAGEPDALPPVPSEPGRSGPVPSEPVPEPTSELVLDADCAQAALVGAVLAGSHLAVVSPPGTGVTQTVANLVAALAGEGRRTLLVTEKRVAIDTVVQRLATVGLDHLVLALPDGGASRRAAADQLAGALARAGAPHAGGLPEGSTSREHPRSTDPLAATADARRLLDDHNRALHAKRSPWGVTAYEAQQALADLTARRPAPRSRVRVGAAGLGRLDRVELGRIADQLREAAHDGVLDAGPDDDPWFSARLETPDDAARALEVVTELNRLLPDVRRQLSALLDAVGMPPARSVADWAAALELLGGVRQSLEVFSAQVFDSSLADVVAATASGEWRAEHGVQLSLLQRRRLRAEARALLRPGAPPPDLHAALVAAAEQRAAWQAAAGPGSRPMLPSGYLAADQAYGQLAERLDWLAARLGGPAGAGVGELVSVDLDVLADRLAALQSRATTLPLVPRRVAVHDRLDAVGLGPLLADLAQRSVRPDEVDAELELVWWTSLLEHVAATDPAYGGHDGAALRSAALQFAEGDRKHVRAQAGRVRRAAATRLGAALAAHPDQAAVLQAHVARPTGHRPLLELVGSCPDVLAAAVPIWALSPLAVPQVLPPGLHFDVVVIAEASAVSVAAALPAISRARQVVVVGDPAGLPPRAFLTSAQPDSPASRPVAGSASDHVPGMVSVLDALLALLPVPRLRRNYRCRDERLMAFAAEHIYGGELETLPGPDGGDAPGGDDGPGGDDAPHGDDALRLEQVDGTGPVVAGVDAVESTDAEVFRVVDLVLDHARRRPGESLGVVTLTARHAARIDEALHRAAAEDPGLARFFDASRDEPFVVKDVERAQGDTRDAVLLSIGYGRTPHGRVLHAFGPLSAPGGERRLAVATTRARRRLTVVSSFGADDLDPARLETAGARLLRELLAYAAAGGSPGAGVSPPPSYRDPLLDDLAARLEADGLTVRRRYGISGSLDLAVGDESGRLLVAVESDGPAYAAMSSTRERDRLRVEHLQRLGWSHLRLWSTDIFRDPAREVARVKAALRAAAGPVRAVPVEQTRDDTDAGWGESAAPHDRERWLLDERPPHWG